MKNKAGRYTLINNNVRKNQKIRKNIQNNRKEKRMVIRRMNNVLIKHNKILFGLFSIIIIVAFVWFFTPGVDGSMFFGGPASDSSIVARAAGKELTLKEYRNAMKKQAIVLALSYNTTPAAFQDLSNDQIFAGIVLAVAAEKYGLTASDKEVVDFIKRLPQFKGAKGEFDNVKYSLYVEQQLAPLNMGARDLEEAIRSTLATEKLGRMLESTVVTEDEIACFQDLTMEKTFARMIRFDAADYKDQVKVTEKEIKDYYTANSKTLLTEPQIRGLYVKFPYAVYAAKNPVKDAEAKKYYDANKLDYIKDGKEQSFAKVKAAIIRKLSAEKAEAAAMEAARNFREKLYKISGEAEDGASQIAYFKKFAAEGKLVLMDTAWLKRNSIEVQKTGKEPMLVSALFGTSVRYPVTKSVRGNTGAFVACVTERKEAKTADYKDVKEEIRTQLAARKARQKAAESMRAYAAKIAASKNPAAEVAKALAGTKGKVTALPVFSYDTLNEFNKDNVPAKFVAMNLIPGTATNTLSKAGDLPDGGQIAVFVDRRVQPTAAEKAKDKAGKKELYEQMKKSSSVSGLQSWIFSNSANMMKQQENAR